MSLPLPTGAATAAKQDTGNASLATIATTLVGEVTTPLRSWFVNLDDISAGAAQNQGLGSLFGQNWQFLSDALLNDAAATATTTRSGQRVDAADGLSVEDNDYWCNVGHYSTASATSQKSSVPAPDLSAANQIGSLGRRNRS